MRLANLIKKRDTVLMAFSPRWWPQPPTILWDECHVRHSSLVAAMPRWEKTGCRLDASTGCRKRCVAGVLDGIEQHFNEWLAALLLHFCEAYKMLGVGIGEPATRQESFEVPGLADRDWLEIVPDVLPECSLLVVDSNCSSIVGARPPSRRSGF